MSVEYEREKLGNAVSLLASSSQPIQKRLEYAFMAMHTLKAHGLEDPANQLAYDRIYDALTADKSDAREGHAPKTTRLLSDDDAEKIAEMIVELDSTLNNDRIWKLEDQLRQNS